MKLKEFIYRKRQHSDSEVNQYLIQSIALEDYTSAYKINRIMRLVSLLVIGLLCWCYFTSLPEITSAQGEVVPQGRLLRVKHLEGGTVEDILVRNGDIVESDQLLLVLDDSLLKSEMRSLQSSKAGMLLTIERLSALLDTRELQIDQWKADYPFLVETQIEHYQQQLEGYKFRKNSIAQQKIHRKIELDSKSEQLNAAQEELDILSQNYDMHMSLFERGLLSKSNALDTAALLAASRNRLAKIKNEMEIIRHSLQELEEKSQEITAMWREQLNSEKTKVVTQLSVTNEQIAEMNTRIKKMKIFTPVNGIVKGLTVNSNHTVVAPGEIMMEVIPTDDELLVEARIAPEDIGHIAMGHTADVKVSSYEHQKFGSIKGEVMKMSPSTYIDSENNPYYLAEIKLSKSYVGTNSELNRIYPGMTVRADIITNRKTILEYLLRPLQRGFDGAFSER
ncbi:HlyD family type I secretion periplasmic adaptor subunit [Ketobacter sp. MCCC 1A13808]|uniref:HlyD family type I secretion periplasmic adaptor subunit n=1 Tax=Ketobacter sp. MCCC 1A13808 TaxID=2602738 RepID=UPI0012EC52D1|nr:HlyD family type I secretion periplasmic adaptor subunit [Ketobacter sp. MCCC 1A13808]MVF13195.1 HlyD family type I secretion periplasmic adaptor subunit [Ketobacter sp. MCCC 1A13808]